MQEVQAMQGFTPLLGATFPSCVAQYIDGIRQSRTIYWKIHRLLVCVPSVFACAFKTMSNPREAPLAEHGAVLRKRYMASGDSRKGPLSTITKEDDVIGLHRGDVWYVFQ